MQAPKNQCLSKNKLKCKANQLITRVMLEIADMIDRKKGATSRRLKFLRERLGYRKPGRFADYLGISAARWSNVENGFPCSLKIAQLLRKKIAGLDLDWIYYGDPTGLSERMAKLLGEQPPGDENFKPPK